MNLSTDLINLTHHSDKRIISDKQLVNIASRRESEQVVINENLSSTIKQKHIITNKNFKTLQETPKEAKTVNLADIKSPKVKLN